MLRELSYYSYSNETANAIYRMCGFLMSSTCFISLKWILRLNDLSEMRLSSSETLWGWGVGGAFESAPCWDVVSCRRGDPGLTPPRLWPCTRYGMWPRRRPSCAWELGGSLVYVHILSSHGLPCFCSSLRPQREVPLRNQTDYNQRFPESCDPQGSTPSFLLPISVFYNSVVLPRIEFHHLARPTGLHWSPGSNRSGVGG